MRDIPRLAATLRQIAAEGGLARRLSARPRGFTWCAGPTVLNGQAVSDLIADGWLSDPEGTDHSHIVAFPSWLSEGGSNDSAVP